jgi:hypothetical protein
LHRPDDVGFLHGGPATDLRVRRRGHREVRHGGHVGGAEQPQQFTGSQVGLAQLDTGQLAGELGRRGHAVYADDPLNRGVTGQPGRDARGQVPADACHDDDGRPVARC